MNATQNRIANRPAESVQVFGLVLLMALFTVVGGAQDVVDIPSEDLPLPVWSPEEWQKMVREAAPPVGNGLLPSLGEEWVRGSGVGMQPKYPDGPPPIEMIDETEDLRGRLSLFLPEGLMRPSEVRASTGSTLPTAASQLREVTPDFWSAANQWSPEDLLIDPGEELAETQAEDLRRFLSYHAENALIPIVILVMGRQERLHDAVGLERVAQGSLSARRAALLAYPMGEPWRARLFLPGAAHQTVSESFMTRLVDACLQQAAKASMPDDQLHEYLVQLSIRLFWLQRELSLSITSTAAFANPSLTPPLAEVGGVAAAPPPAGNASLWLTIGVWFSVTLTLAGLTPRLLRRGRRWTARRRQNMVWTFSEAEAPTRLGGAFCGGAGAWSDWN